MSDQVKLISKWLNTQEKTDSGKPIFRIVWSDTQLEKRYGTFNDFQGDLFVRQVTEVRETRKYNYISERWILEKWCPPTFGVDRELPESYNGLYEPIFVFEDAQRNYLPPTLKVVQFIVESARFKIADTPSDKAKRAALAEEQEVKDFEEEIGAKTRSPIMSLINSREAVSMHFNRKRK